LHVASRDGLPEVVKAICERGVQNINALNVEGLSPLHLAARNGHIDVVR
jgi:ankyrin repeat protein